MKKFLSLVLALVMTMSLVTIGAGAKDFADDSKIDYKEAVDVISAVKVVDGYADGSFNPSATLTRGAAAKIICNLILGPTTAGALSADAAPYKDVPANHTFAGYIAYCQKEGIISGYADGTFKPAASLTGYAFMKMLLGALGYKAENEGYVGANWSINVAKQALAIGLDKGLTDDFDGTKPVTREEACLYAFNTLKATMVEYKNAQTIVVGDITVTSSAKASEVPCGENDYTTNSSSGDLTMQFCEKYFPKLKKIDENTAFDEPATTWRYKGEKVGNYVESPDVTYTEKIKLKDIYADLDLSADADTNLYYVNGVDQTASTYDVTKTNDNKVGGQGTVTTVFLDTSSSGKTTVRIVEKQQFIGKIVSIDDATKTTKRTVNLVAKGDAASASKYMYDNGATKFETEDFARGDYVYFTAAQNGSSYDVKSLAVAEKVTGELTAYTGNSSVIVGGTTYKVNAVGMGGQTYDANGDLKDIVDLYLDENGNVLFIETSEAADASYAYVLAAQGTGSSFHPYEAELLFLDGTKKVVKTDADADTSTIKNNFVSFRVNSDEKYVLTADDTNVYADGGNTIDLDSGVSAIKVDGSNYYYGNDATIYLVKTAPNAKTTYTVYTGYKNVPSIAGKVGFDVVCKAGKVANYVFIDCTANNVTPTGGTNNVLFLLADGDAGLTQTNDTSYYTFKAVNNGTVGTIKLDAADYYSNYLKLTGESVIVDGQYTDKYGVTKVTTGAGVTNKAVGVGEVSKSTISVTWNAGNSDFDQTLALASSVNVYVVNTAGEINASDLDAIAHDTNDWVYYTLKDGAVNNIFIVKK